MKKIFLFVFMIAAFTVLETDPAKGDDFITLVADEWCPYNCAPNTDTPRFMIEIAQYAFERLGHTIRYEKIPWARAIRGTREGQYDGIVGAGREETPDFVFPEHGLGRAVHVFYVRQGEAWKYSGLASLEQISLGVVRDLFLWQPL
jgi:polar amino acid transport system substrate-binding protein